MPDSTSAVSTAPSTLAGWVEAFDHHHLPVLSSTVDTLDDLRQREDDVDAHLLADALGADPLFTLKLLAHVAEVRGSRDCDDCADTETLTEALVMLGIPPFFRAFSSSQRAEEALAGIPGALDGFQAVLARAVRAARFSVAFAVHRMDHDVAVLGEAALLHDFAELLLWLHSPAIALQIRERQFRDPGLRSVSAQRTLLGISLSDLQYELMAKWGLPKLLLRITNQHHRDSAQLQNVQLAIRVARHSASGWDNPALPDDYRDVSRLLNLGIEPTIRLLRDIDDA